jgi:hypothetical protein
MNMKSIYLLANASMLALALACGGGGGSTAVPPVAVTVATPVVTAPGYLAIGGAAVTITTQAQSGCTYAWTISGDSTAQMVSGQGTNTITLTATGKVGTTVQASVTVQAETGGSSGIGSATIQEANPPAVPSVSGNTVNYLTTPGQAVTFSTSGEPTKVTYAWTVTGGTLTSGQGTATAEVSTGTPSAFPGSLNVACAVTDIVTGLASSGSVTLPIFDPNAPAPSTPVVTGPGTAKGGTTGLVYTSTAQAGCTYAWILYQINQMPQYVTAGQGTTTATVTAPAYTATGSNQYGVYITVTNGGGQAEGYVNLTVTQ